MRYSIVDDDNSIDSIRCDDKPIDITKHHKQSFINTVTSSYYMHLTTLHAKLKFYSVKRYLSSALFVRNWCYWFIDTTTNYNTIIDRIMLDINQLQHKIQRVVKQVNDINGYYSECPICYLGYYKPVMMSCCNGFVCLICYLKLVSTSCSCSSPIVTSSSSLTCPYCNTPTKIKSTLHVLNINYNDQSCCNIADHCHFTLLKLIISKIPDRFVFIYCDNENTSAGPSINSISMPNSITITKFNVDRIINLTKLVQGIQSQDIQVDRLILICSNINTIKFIVESCHISAVSVIVDLPSNTSQPSPLINIKSFMHGCLMNSSCMDSYYFFSSQCSDLCYVKSERLVLAMDMNGT